MSTCEILQEAKQADATISWVILHYWFVWFGSSSPHPIHLKSRKH